jgi:GDPmannose 4,6-dehydratase
MPRALITGITGQDGSYLAELLLEKGYEVHGLVRAHAAPEKSWLAPLVNNSAIRKRRLFLHRGDLNHPESLREIVTRHAPEEIYHLGGQTNVGLSFEAIEDTCETVGMGTVRLLEIVRQMPRPAKIFHASSGEVFGRPDTAPQDEQTPFRPVTPYGCAKALATQVAMIYRRSFGLFISNGILFNHESPRRGSNFVTQKICLAAAAIKAGRQKELMMGNLTADRDWGDARDYVRGMWQALRHSVPEDFVFATGELHTVQEVLDIAFETVGLNWKDFVKQDPRFLRSDEPVRAVGNPAKAQRLLNWERKTSFKELITEMTLAAASATSQNAPANL